MDLNPILIANTSATFSVNGRRVYLIKDKTTAHSGHDVVKARPHMFTPLEVDFPMAPETTGPRTAPEPWKQPEAPVVEEPATWPGTHAELDDFANKVGFAWPEGVTKVTEKQEALTSAGFVPATTEETA